MFCSIIFLLVVLVSNWRSIVMLNRFEEIDKFLKVVAEKRLKKDEIYDELKTWNIPDVERVFVPNDVYVYDNAGLDYIGSCSDEYWFVRMGFFNAFLLYNIGDYIITDYFKMVGENPFLRFYNPEVTTSYEFKKIEPIKMYMSLGKKDSFWFLYSLMSFCNENRILHNSKIASSIRNDDVVLRVYSLDDAEKVKEYIKNSIFELNNPNPFCLTDGKIGYAMDSGDSYNEFVSKTIDGYISQLDDQTKVGYESFRTYVLNLKMNDVKLLSLKFALDPSKTVQDFYMAWNKIINPNFQGADTYDGLEMQREFEIHKKQERLKNGDSPAVIEERKIAEERRKSLKRNLDFMRSRNFSDVNNFDDFESCLPYLDVINETKEEYEARKKMEAENERERVKMIKSRLQKSSLVKYMNDLASYSRDKNGNIEFASSVQKFRDAYDLDDNENSVSKDKKSL